MNGVELWSQHVADTDIIGDTWIIGVTLSEGSALDFVIDPGEDTCGDATRLVVTILKPGPGPALPDYQFVDYHVQSGSAAMDVGIPIGSNQDIDGDYRPTRPGYEIGADEYLGADSDDDNSPDWWEIQYLFNPHDAGDSGLDPDGDEVAAGTDPLDADSDGVSDGTEVATRSNRHITLTPPAEVEIRQEHP